MKEVKKAETQEASDAITESIDKTSKEEEKKAVERAVAHVEKIRQQKLKMHESALKEIEGIKTEAQKKHDAINEDTKKATEAAIKKATDGLYGLDKTEEAQALAQEQK